jgi:beta-glucosidase
VEVRGRQPLFPFGFGLSYTSFNYKNLEVSPRISSRGETIKVTVEVENTGKYEGDEVVQLYIKDKVSRIVRPVLELKRFKRIHLKPGESQKVEFLLGEEDLAFLDEDLKPIVEPGQFEVLVGWNSEQGLRATFEVK